MSEKEFTMVELFRKLDMNRPVALTIATLADGDEITSRQIESTSELRQPEVSIAMKYLIEMNWVDIREEKMNEGKGRPVKIYQLTVPIEEIVHSVEKDILYEREIKLEYIEKLKQLT